MSYKNNISLYMSDLASNGASENTLSSYSRTLNRFGEFMNEKGFDEPTIEAVAAFKATLADSGLKITTLGLYMTHIHAFFAWAVDCKLYAENPCVGALMPSNRKMANEQRRSYSMDKVLGENDLMAVIASEKPKGIRACKWPQTKAILSLFLASGIRNSELCALTPSNLDYANGVIHVEHGKGDKERLCSFPVFAQNAVREYLASDIRPKELTDIEPLFGINDKKGFRPYERIGMSQLIERNIAAITGREGIRSHALRHSYASIMSSNGMSTRDLQELLGHASVVTTERYIERLNPQAPAGRTDEIFSKILAA